MATKRKLSGSSTESPIKMESQEDSSLGNDYMVAKGRLQGVLKLLTEQSDSDNSSSHDDDYSHREQKRRKPKITAFRHTYVMKLFDRSVDLAKFEEDTPLYPICRAWMANQPRNTQSVQSKRRPMSPNANIWSSNSISDVYRLPQPKGAANPAARIPSPTPQQKNITNDINLNYEKNPPVSKEELIKDHLKRWVGIKRKWIKTAAVNEERYSESKIILQAIYNKAQDALME